MKKFITLLTITTILFSCEKEPKTNDDGIGKTIYVTVIDTIMNMVYNYGTYLFRDLNYDFNDSSKLSLRSGKMNLGNGDTIRFYYGYNKDGNPYSDEMW